MFFEISYVTNVLQKLLKTIYFSTKNYNFLAILSFIWYNNLCISIFYTIYSGWANFTICGKEEQNWLQV